MDYDLELEKAASIIREEGARKICVQLPDGLKPHGKEIVDYLNSNTEAKIVLWAGSCFGACDTPNLDENEYDLLIQWGHSEWKR